MTREELYIIDKVIAWLYSKEPEVYYNLMGDIVNPIGLKVDQEHCIRLLMPLQDENVLDLNFDEATTGNDVGIKLLPSCYSIIKKHGSYSNYLAHQIAEKEKTESRAETQDRLNRRTYKHAPIILVLRILVAVIGVASTVYTIVDLIEESDPSTSESIPIRIKDTTSTPKLADSNSMQLVDTSQLEIP